MGAAGLGAPSVQEAQDCSEKGEGCPPTQGPASSLFRGPGQGQGCPGSALGTGGGRRWQEQPGGPATLAPAQADGLWAGEAFIWKKNVCSGLYGLQLNKKILTLYVVCVRVSTYKGWRVCLCGRVHTSLSVWHILRVCVCTPTGPDRLTQGCVWQTLPEDDDARPGKWLLSAGRGPGVGAAVAGRRWVLVGGCKDSQNPPALPARPSQRDSAVFPVTRGVSVPTPPNQG